MHLSETTDIQRDCVTQKILSKLVILESVQVSFNRCYLENKFNISKFRSKGLLLVVLEQVSEGFFERLSINLCTYLRKNILFQSIQQLTKIS